MNKLKLKIVTPEKEILSSEVDEVVAPSTQGALGIYPHHMNIMVRLDPGELVMRADGKEEFLAVGGGFLQVMDNTVTVMTDLAANVSEIDEKSIEDARKRAQEALSNKLTHEQYVSTLAAFKLAD